MKKPMKTIDRNKIFSASLTKLRRDRGSQDDLNVQKDSSTDIMEERSYLEQGEVAGHRFVDFVVDLKSKEKQINLLKPSMSQILKNQSQQPFGSSVRGELFPVKPEHATVC